jgi:predicted GNAT superfamily acetyltransferase
VADAFGRAFYGEMTDEINAGDRSDRLVVRWDLDQEPAARSWPQGLPDVLTAEGDPEDPRPVPGSAPTPDGAVVEVPRDHGSLRSRDPALAARWREAAAEALEACFRSGLIAGAFDRARSAYALVPGESP